MTSHLQSLQACHHHLELVHHILQIFLGRLHLHPTSRRGSLRSSQVRLLSGRSWSIRIMYQDFSISEESSVLLSSIGFGFFTGLKKMVLWCWAGDILGRAMKNILMGTGMNTRCGGISKKF